MKSEAEFNTIMTINQISLKVLSSAKDPPCNTSVFSSILAFHLSFFLTTALIIYLCSPTRINFSM